MNFGMTALPLPMVKPTPVLPSNTSIWSTSDGFIVIYTAHRLKLQYNLPTRHYEPDSSADSSIIPPTSPQVNDTAGKTYANVNIMLLFTPFTATDAHKTGKGSPFWRTAVKAIKTIA